MDPLPSKMPKKPKNENPVDYTGKHAEGAWLGDSLIDFPTEHQTGLSVASVLIYSFSSNPSQYHLCHYAHETPDGGGWGGKVSEQKEEEDSEERYRHLFLGLLDALLPVKVHPKVGKSLLFKALLFLDVIVMSFLNY